MLLLHGHHNRRVLMSGPCALLLLSPPLPVLQEKSYFALRLPAGWWVFGLDLALVGDIDMCQYRCGVDAMARLCSVVKGI
jgi:hypothetical protein